MSGTSGDGVDASVINSDGKGYYKVLINKYFKYSDEISQNIYKLKRNINKIDDVKKFSKEINRQLNLINYLNFYHLKRVRVNEVLPDYYLDHSL